MRPRVFIGSSREGLKLAAAVKQRLSNEADIDLWNNHKIFPVGELTLPKLESCASNYDFALIILTPDDIVRSRQNTKSAPRDNLIFEAGLFMGRIGRQRTLIIQSDRRGLKLPSDFSGLTVAFYRDGLVTRDLHESVRLACEQVGDAFKILGISESRRVSALGQASESMIELVGRTERLLSGFESQRKWFDSVNSAGPALLEAMKKLENDNLPVTIDWLGMTMFNVWNTLPGVLSQLVKSRPVLKMRVAMLAHDWLKKNRVNSEWTAESADHQAAAIGHYFIDRRREGLKWDVEIRRYSHMPAVHGGLVSNRWLLLGMCQWDRNNNLWAGDKFYDWYQSDDRSRGAERIAVFKGWFDICWKSASDPSMFQWKVRQARVSKV